MAIQTPRLIRLFTALYARLLVCYPPAHRRTYGPWMLQMFCDLARDSYAQHGASGLVIFWLHTLFDLVQSAFEANAQALEEVLMAVSTSLKPMSWPGVLLVVAPGILFGISRVYAPLGIFTRIAFLLIAVLALGVLIVREGLPAWSFLVLGLVANFGLMLLIFVVPDALQSSLRIDFNTGQLLVGIPLWLAILALAWRSKITWKLPLWVWTLLFLGTLVALSRRDLSLANAAGLMLFSVAVGLPLSRRYGALAVLFVVGGFSVWLTDSDTISGYLLRDLAFYPYYAVLLPWLFISLGPLFFVRARTRTGQFIGLLAPIALMLISRVAVPWLIRPDFHPASIWINESLMSAFTLALLALALALYTRSEPPPEPGPTAEDSRLAYSP